MRGDTSDLDRKLTVAERGILRLNSGALKLDNAFKGANLSTGRLGNQFANLASHITGVSPIVGNLATVLGDFAIGGAVTAGVLAGVAAITVVFDKLTEATREMTKAQNDAIAAIEREGALKILGPGGETVANVAKAKDRAAALKTQITSLEALIVKDAQDADVLASNAILQKKINDLYVERQSALNKVAEGEDIIRDKVAAATPKVQELTFGFNELRKAAEQVNAAVIKEKTDWWKGYIDRTNEALTITEQLNNEINASRPSMVEALKFPAIPEVSMPNFQTPFEGLTDAQKDQLRQLGVLTDKNDKNANMLHDAIWGSASQLANTVVNALNVGGGGKGSSIGGAVGGSAGFSLGYWGMHIGSIGGPIGGAVGALVGNIAGSLIGGLFDHKKAVVELTSATRALTQSMLQGTPIGFKIEPYRYMASDAVRQRQSEFGRYRARGGPVMIPT